MARIRHIFRWDLDKTYLKTEFDSVRDLVRTARLTAEERENIPGAAALIRAIRDCAPGDLGHLVYFISGSPQQMRSVLEKKFALDGFMPDEFVLKPTVAHLLRGRFRAIRGQVSYKLAQLLRGRGDAPVGTEETLFGDDAESDAFIYSLYADLIAGRVPRDMLKTLLKGAGAYQSQMEEIDELLEAVIHEDPVKRIVIHLDQHTPPITFVPYFPRVVPIYNHLQTAIVLYLDGTLVPEAIRNVGRELIAQYGFEVPRLVNLAEDILRRRRLRFQPETLDKLAADLRGLKAPSAGEDQPEDGEIDDATHRLVEEMASRAEYLRDRPPPTEPDGPDEPDQDYLKLYKFERERLDEAKRARKLHAKMAAAASQAARKES